MAISVATLKSLYLQSRAYYTLTDRGDDSIAELALTTAETWVRACYSKAGKTPDITLSAVEQAIYAYAVYWLYSRNEQEAIAADKYLQAKTLIETALGEAGAADPNKPRPCGPLASCSSPDAPSGWEGY